MSILINVRTYASKEPADSFGGNLALDSWFKFKFMNGRPLFAQGQPDGVKYADGEVMTVANITRRFFSQPITDIGDRCHEV